MYGDGVQALPNAELAELSTARGCLTTISYHERRVHHFALSHSPPLSEATEGATYFLIQSRAEQTESQSLVPGGCGKLTGPSAPLDTAKSSCGGRNGPEERKNSHENSIQAHLLMPSSTLHTIYPTSSVANKTKVVAGRQDRSTSSSSTNTRPTRFLRPVWHSIGKHWHSC